MPCYGIKCLSKLTDKEVCQLNVSSKPIFNPSTFYIPTVSFGKRNGF